MAAFAWSCGDDDDRGSRDGGAGSDDDAGSAGAGAGGMSAGAGGAGGSGDATGPFLRLTRASAEGGLKTGTINFAVASGRAFFGATDGTSSGIWVTDGTPAGTRFVTNRGENPKYFFHELNGKILFPGRDAASGSEPWITDGTEAGTKLIKDINPGPGHSLPRFFGRAGNRLYFVADDGVHGVEIWTTDGTEAGTRLIRDINPGTAGQEYLEATGGDRALEWNNKLYFYANDAARMQQLWVTDGTEDGTRMLTPGESAGSIVLIDYTMVVYRDRLFFTYHSKADGKQLWSSDGTPAGTKLFKKLASTGAPQDLHVLGDRLIFVGYGGGDATVLWASDGTPEGTQIISPVQHFPSDFRMAKAGGKLVFTGRPNISAPFTLWVTDGTSAGTSAIADVRGASDHHNAQLGDKLVIYAGPASATDYEPWITDGTRAGTKLIADMYPGNWSSDSGPYNNPTTLMSLGSKAYFLAEVAKADFLLFETDGTTAGTKALAPADATIVKNAVRPAAPFAFGKMLLLFADFHGQTELYRYMP